MNLYAKAAVNDQFGLSTGLELGAGSFGKGGLHKVGAATVSRWRQWLQALHP